LPLKEALTIDINGFDEKYNCELHFSSKNRLLGKVDIPIPKEVDGTDEIEVNF
jgi:hypothetical protein